MTPEQQEFRRAAAAWRDAVFCEHKVQPVWRKEMRDGVEVRVQFDDLLNATKAVARHLPDDYDVNALLLFLYVFMQKNLIF